MEYNISHRRPIVPLQGHLVLQKKKKNMDIVGSGKKLKNY